MMHNGLPDKLSPEQWRGFLDRAFPELQRDYAQLDAYLEQQSWLDAKQLAHKLKGIVRLLDMDPLLDDLTAINEMPLEEPMIVISEAFRKAFRQRHQAYLSSWCNQHLPKPV